MPYLQDTTKLDVPPGKYRPITDDHSDNVEHSGAITSGGHTSARVTEKDDVDFQRRLTSCNKNPGHTRFIPIDTFSLNHLPTSYRDTELYEFLKVVADLTARVDAKTFIQVRAKIPGNPFASVQETDYRTGSGRVWNVTRYADGLSQHGQRHKKPCYVCPCFRCQQEDKPSKVWWEIHVETSCDLVSKGAEVSHCVFFCGGQNGSAVLVERVLVDSVNLENCSTMLICVTCDVSLAERLQKLWRRYDELWSAVSDKFLKCKDGNKLTFIVSHPNGRPKHVSINQWRGRYELDDDLFHHRMTYTTCTCPESSGSFIYMLGYGWGLGGWHQAINI